MMLEQIRKYQRGDRDWTVFDACALREKAINEPAVPSEMVANIEEVDLPGPAHKISELA